MLLYLCLTVLYDCKENNVINGGIPVVAVPPNQKTKTKQKQKRAMLVHFSCTSL